MSTTANLLRDFCLRTGSSLALLLVLTPVVSAQSGLPQQIATAAPGAIVEVRAGVTGEPLTIDRSLTLRGVSPEESTLEVTADRPALSVTDKAEVTLESMTIRWQLETSEPQPGPPTAIFVKDATLRLKNCRIIAPADPKRCPSGILADGFSRLTLEDCTIEGFEFAVNVSGGAEAVVADCIVLRPGHCGLSVFSDSKLNVTRCIIARSAFHSLRSTGGNLTAVDNLILHNKNRGIYLGNRSAQATIRGNVFLANATGISGFARTEATIEQNVFLDAEYAAIDSRETCRLKIADNILQGNERGVVLHGQADGHRLQLEANTFWDNQVDVENIALPDGALTINPQLADPSTGKFVATTESVVTAGHGLSKQAPIAALWERWQQVSKPSE